VDPIAKCLTGLRPEKSRTAFLWLRLRLSLRYGGLEPRRLSLYLKGTEFSPELTWAAVAGSIQPGCSPCGWDYFSPELPIIRKVAGDPNIRRTASCVSLFTKHCQDVR